eukprot:2439034-Rhodomonas_salina.1
MPPKSDKKRARDEWEYGFDSEAEFFRRTLRFVFSVALERLFPDRRYEPRHPDTLTHSSGSAQMSFC